MDNMGDSLTNQRDLRLIGFLLTLQHSLSFTAQELGTQKLISVSR